MLKHFNINNKYNLFILSLLLLLCYYIVNTVYSNLHSKHHEFESFSQSFDIQSIKLIGVSDAVGNNLETNGNELWNSLDSVLQNKNISCFVSENDSIIYWNNNTIDYNILYKLSLDNKLHCIKLSTGWYLYSGKRRENKVIQVFNLIKTDYQVNNRLLIRSFSTPYLSSQNISLTLDETKSDHIINDSNGRFLIGLIYTDQDNHSRNTNYVALLLFLAGFVILLYAFINFFIGIVNLNKITKFTLFLILTTLIWSILHFFDFPTGLKKSSIFIDDIYNIPLSGSIGDLIINTITIVIVFNAAYLLLSGKVIRKAAFSIFLQYTLLWSSLLLIVMFLYHIALERDYSIIYETTLFSYNSISYITVITGLNISIYFILITFLNTTNSVKTPKIVPVIIIFFEAFLLIAFIDIPLIPVVISVSASIIIVFLKFLIWNNVSDLFFKHLILLIFLATISSFVINIALSDKSDLDQQKIVSTLSVSRDSVFEDQYPYIHNKIINDEYIQKILFNDSLTTDADIEQYLKYKYFTGYYAKYKIQVTNCTEDQLIEIQPEGSIYNCVNYFNDLIDNLTIPVSNSNLFQFNAGNESVYYISKLILNDPHNDSNKRNIFLEFISSHVPEGLGYPELLVDNRSQKLNLSNYSFAKYTNNILSYKFGDFSYTTDFSKYNPINLNKYFNYKGYRHYAVETNGGDYIIVSRKQTPATLKLVVFSMVFIILVIISVIIYLILFARKALYLFRFNFKTRLQTFVLATLTMTFILMAIATLVYFEENSKNEVEKQLSEKTNSVLIELQHKLANISDFTNEDPDFLHQLLRKFSLVFFSDINLYDKSGVLIATSRPEIFEKSLKSYHINPSAYDAIFNKNELNYLTEENIGLLKYFSSYVPINLNSSSPIGIVNLPYFARQSEYTESYYVMLSYLLNIYVIIGIIGTLIAVIFSRYLTRPLVLLHDSISNISIDKHNEKIQWNRNDEIGLLIKEYNRMVEKLEQSADLLKLSERESAWREIAKQIAHEIKNPLTPMKLNVQYLEKSYKNNDPEFDSKIESVSKSLITQIDTLNNVAEMFSNFASNKKIQFGTVELRKIIISSINLFNKSKDLNITADFDNETSDYNTYGYEKDILRVINNILKNATQAVENTKTGEISVRVNKDNDFIHIAITDNGKGISEEMKSSIFQPYFTTKTSGTGLGLAIVKNIMNEIGGEVNFESELNKGTTFLLRFPDSDSTS